MTEHKAIPHVSVNYAPGQLPAKYAVVDDQPDAPLTVRNPGSDAEWRRIRSEIDDWVYKRKCMYDRMLTVVLAFLVAGLLSPWIQLILVPVGVYYFRRMKEYRANTVKACEDLRHIVIDEELAKEGE